MSDQPHVLPDLPPMLAETRASLHQLAFFALAPHRHAHVGRLGLRSWPGGFGTPWFDGPGGRRRARMDGDDLVVDTDAGTQRSRPTTLRAACATLGLEYEEVWFPDFHDPLAPRDPDARLVLEHEAALALGTWFGFGTHVLEELARTPGAVDASTVTLWPEHFDPALELGDADAGRRASYGASPGDADHPAPYLYVAPWGEVGDDPYWDDDAFGGASLPYEALLDADAPTATALAFLRRGHDLLHG